MNVGEALERKYRRRKLVVLAVSAIASALGVVVLKLAGDEDVVFPSAFGAEFASHPPLLIRIVLAAAFLGALGLLARWNWSESDEVRRSHILSFWAAIGISVSITFFGFILFGRDIPDSARLPLAFLLPLALGLIFSIARWLRDGYVW